MYVKYSSWMKHLDFILLDLICINLSLCIAYWCRFSRVLGIARVPINMYAVQEYRILAIFATVMLFCIAFFSNYYSGILRRGYFDEFKKVGSHNLVLFFTIMLFLFALQAGDDYSRIIVVMFFFIDYILMYLEHSILKKILLKREEGQHQKDHMLIVASKDIVEEVIAELRNGPDQRFRLVGIAILEEDFAEQEVLGVPIVSKGGDIYDYARTNVVDDVMLCLNNNELQNEMIHEFLAMGITVQVKLDVYLKGNCSVFFSKINEANVAIISNNNVHVFQLFLKRVLDICAGLVGCIITGVLFVFVAPAIKIADSKGPVFFKQQRVGRNGRIFNFYKFRSMYSDAEERKKELMEQNKMQGLMFKLDADPRIIGSGPDGTRKGLGHFLRASSIDEFPNFWSILKGDMSLVGTRPPTMDEYERYELHHKSRLAAKPGLTGLWQVSGRSEMTDFEEIVKLDNEYIQSWNIGKDINIVLKTVWVVLARKGSQ